MNAMDGVIQLFERSTPEQREEAIDELLKRYKFGYALIPEVELEVLKDDSSRLGKLKAAGVDNWEGYSQAFEDEE